MVKSTTIVSNLFKHAASSFTSFLIFILFINIGRVLGTQDFGKFSFALAFVFLFDPLLDPGLHHLLIREISRKKSMCRHYLSTALSWKVLSAPIVIIIIAVIVHIIQDDQKTIMAVYLITGSLCFKSTKDPFRTALLAHEYFGLEAISAYFENVSLLVCGLISLYAGYGLLGICSVYLFVRLIDLIVIIIIVSITVCPPSINFDFKAINYLVVTSLPIGAFYITLNVYNYIDTVMLSIIKTDSEVGLYNASYKIYEGLIIFPVIIGTVLMPRLSQYYKTNHMAFKELFSNGLKYIIILGLIVTTNGLLLSKTIIPILFGIEYNMASISLNILLIGIIFSYIINFLNTALITMDLQKIMLQIAVFGLVCNVALNFIFIPFYGYVGAAWATIIVQGIVMIITYGVMVRFKQKISLTSVFIRPVTTILLLFTFVWYLIPENFVVYRLIILNIMIISSIFFLKVLSRNDLDIIINMLPIRQFKKYR